MHQHSNYRGPRRRRERERIWENIWRDYSWNLPQHGKWNSHPSPGSAESPSKKNPRKNKLRHIVIRLTKIKDKEKLLKATREKRKITYKGTPIRLTADFSAEALQARREWHGIFKVMKEDNLQPRLLYPARISFRFNGKIRSFTDKEKLREFSTTKPALQQMLKELLWVANTREEKDLQKQTENN